MFTKLILYTPYILRVDIFCMHSHRHRIMRVALLADNLIMSSIDNLKLTEIHVINLVFVDVTSCSSIL